MRFFVFLFACALAPVVYAAPPNIVVLFSDDAGYADFGFQKNADPALAALTPNITRLAKEGVVFSQAYVTGAVCSPSPKPNPNVLRWPVSSMVAAMTEVWSTMENRR